MSNVDWGAIYSEMNTQGAFSLFHSVLVKLYKKYFSLRKLKLNYHNRKPSVWIKFDDDWSNGSTWYPADKMYPFKHENRKQTLTSRGDVTSDVINIKSTFVDNFWRSLHIRCQIEPIWNISKFSNWPPFWGPDELLNRKLYRILSLESSSNIDGVIAISKCDLFFFYLVA